LNGEPRVLKQDSTSDLIRKNSWMLVKAESMGRGSGQDWGLINEGGLWISQMSAESQCLLFNQMQIRQSEAAG
jgi:hypothetical protein